MSRVGDPYKMRGRVVELRERYEAGATIEQLSADFKIARTTVYRIIRGYSYARAGGPVQPAENRLWHRGLDEIILRHVGRFPRTFGEIYADVINDYGDVCRRIVHRHIAKLITDGKICAQRINPGLREYRRCQSSKVGSSR